MFDRRNVRFQSPAQRGSRWRGSVKTLGRLFLLGVQRWQRQKAIAQFQRLDDWQLEDIGISRNDIPRIVDGLFSSKDHATVQSSANRGQRGYPSASEGDLTANLNDSREKEREEVHGLS